MREKEKKEEDPATGEGEGVVIFLGRPRHETVDRPDENRLHGTANVSKFLAGRFIKGVTDAGDKLNKRIRPRTHCYSGWSPDGGSSIILPNMLAEAEKVRLTRNTRGSSSSWCIPRRRESTRLESAPLKPWRSRMSNGSVLKQPILAG